MKPHIQQQIQQLIGISAEAFAHMQFENAYEFLQLYIGNDDWSISYITNTSTFWNWWRMQWQHRDEAFLQLMNRQIEAGKPALQKYYKRMHNPNFLACEPPTALIHLSYARMSKQMIKERKKVNS